MTPSRTSPRSSRGRGAVLRAASAALLLAAGIALGACASDGETARTRQEVLFDSARSDDARVVVLEVTESRGRFTVSEFALEALRRAPGVMEAKRGVGTNEAYALITPEADPETLVLSLESRGFKGRVLKVLTKADIEARNQ